MCRWTGPLSLTSSWVDTHVRGLEREPHIAALDQVQLFQRRRRHLRHQGDLTIYPNANSVAHQLDAAGPTPPHVAWTTFGPLSMYGYGARMDHDEDLPRFCAGSRHRRSAGHLDRATACDSLEQIHSNPV